MGASAMAVDTQRRSYTAVPRAARPVVDQMSYILDLPTEFEMALYFYTWVSHVGALLWLASRGRAKLRNLEIQENSKPPKPGPATRLWCHGQSPDEHNHRRNVGSYADVVIER